MCERDTGRFMMGTARWTIVALVAAVVVACGGGGSSSNDTPAVGQAMFSVGAITGFGSVHLNGKKFETSKAKIMVNGQSGTQGDLQVGDVVEVKGHHDANAGTDVADEIDFRDSVRGPLASIDSPQIDPATHTLVVLGQNVLVSADTSFGDGISPASIAGLKVGDILEVSGQPNANGDILATRIERKPAGTSFEVLGPVSATDSNVKTFKIHALTIDFSTAMLQNFPSGGPKDGDLVEATGASLGAAGQLLASQVELRTGNDMQADVNADEEVEGPVTRFVSATDFDVAGRTVTTTGSTTFVGGPAADLMLNVRVEVEGSVDSSGVLVASKVQFEHPATVRVRAKVDTVDTTAGTLTVLGVKFTATAITRFEDDSANHVSTFNLSSLHVSDWVEVRGSESPAGSNQLSASRIERVDTQTVVELEGPVKMATSPQFTILSVPVNTTATTAFSDATEVSVTASVFFTGLVGKDADVHGTWDGTTLTAQSAALSNEHH